MIKNTKRLMLALSTMLCGTSSILAKSTSSIDIYAGPIEYQNQTLLN